MGQEQKASQGLGEGGLADFRVVFVFKQQFIFTTVADSCNSAYEFPMKFAIFDTVCAAGIEVVGNRFPTFAIPLVS